MFMLGIPIGTILGVGIGAWTAADFGWRWAFAITGGLGLIVAASVFLFLREPIRGAHDDSTEESLPYRETGAMVGMRVIPIRARRAGPNSEFVVVRLARLDRVERTAV